MSRRPTSAPSSLCIWQQNAWKLQAAHQHILSADPSLYDLILVQEPWINHLGKSRGSNYWQVLYSSNYYQDGRANARLIILVYTNLNTNAYTQLEIMHSDIMALCLSRDFRHCSIFNIYNDCTNNNTLTALCSYLTDHIQIACSSPHNYMFWMGNFNCHYLMWEEVCNRHLYSSDTMIEPLLDLNNDYTMVQSLPLGIPTYKAAMQNWTWPDNVWHTDSADDPIVTTFLVMCTIGHHLYSSLLSLRTTPI